MMGGGAIANANNDTSIVIFGMAEARSTVYPVSIDFFSSDQPRLCAKAPCDCDDPQGCNLPISPTGWYRILICGMPPNAPFACAIAPPEPTDIGSYVNCQGDSGCYPIAYADDEGSFYIEVKLHEAGDPSNKNIIRVDINGDQDEDDLPDWWEVQYFGDIGSQRANYDPDNDTLTNIEEYLRYTDPTQRDTDRDGLWDAVETNTGVYIDQNNTGTDPNAADTDGDTLPDGDELDPPAGYRASNPTLYDSDGDEISDKIEAPEVIFGLPNPWDPMDPDSAGNDFSNVGNGRIDGKDDYDGDDMNNSYEIAYNYNPLKPMVRAPAVNWIGRMILCAAAVVLMIRLYTRREIC